MKAFLAWLMGEGCPVCGRRLTQTEAGYHVCKCGVAVDFQRGGWRYEGEHKLRRLPGMAGISHDSESAA